MSIDKFGRSAENNNKINTIRGPKGDGFQFTDEGDFDIKGKRLSNVGLAITGDDAINIKYYNDRETKFMKKVETEILNPIKDHIKQTDKLARAIEVTKNYIKINHKRRIVNVGESVDQNDVIIQKQFDEKINEYNQNILDIKTNCVDLNIRFNALKNDFETFQKTVKNNIDLLMGITSLAHTSTTQ